MPLHPTTWDIALRLALSLVAGFLIGLNREEHGSPAGLRTTILVCMAAAISMVQMNLLLSAAGKSVDSFAVMDVMRLPLGVLSGMGFIGAGAILRRGKLVTGITTAATLWFVTMVGLAFGGGQIGLGLVSLGIGIFVLGFLKSLERHLRWDRQAALIIDYDGAADMERPISEKLLGAGMRILSFSAMRQGERRRLAWKVSWSEKRSQYLPPEVIRSVQQDRSFTSVGWQPDGFEPPKPPE